jgi:hypothetical protein
LLGASLFVANPVDQARECTPSSSDEARHLLELALVHEVKPFGHDALSLHFVERATGIAQKFSPFTVCEPSLPLGDVAHHADRRPPQLRDKPIQLRFRKARGDVIHRDHNVQRPLKRHEILE